MGKMRRAVVEVTYKNDNITEDLLPYLQEFKIVDNLEGQLDSVELTLLNKNNKFMLPGWSFKKGDILTFSIKTINWENENDGEKNISLGIFYIDEREYTKDSAKIKGVSAPLEALDVVNSNTWANITLKRLGEEIANKYKLKFSYYCNRDIKLVNLIQEKETDFSFLNKIAQDEGIKLKITNSSLVLFEEDEFTKSEPVMTIDLLSVIDFNLIDRSSGIYDSVEVSYFDTIEFKEKKVIKTIEELRGKKGESTKKTLKLKKKPSSRDLNLYALKQLEKANRRQQEIEIKQIGNRRMYAGATFNITNSGEYNGKYLITQVIKKLPGYIDNIKAYRVEVEEK